LNKPPELLFMFPKIPFVVLLEIENGFIVLGFPMILLSFYSKPRGIGAF